MGIKQGYMLGRIQVQGAWMPAQAMNRRRRLMEAAPASCCYSSAYPSTWYAITQAVAVPVHAPNWQPGSGTDGGTGSANECWPDPRHRQPPVLIQKPPSPTTIRLSPGTYRPTLLRDYVDAVGASSSCPPRNESEHMNTLHSIAHYAPH